jgi:dihydroorotate dehydrogenase (NAD+) catalytic subunit
MIDLAPRHKHGLTLANPVMNAAGTLGFAQEYRGLIRLNALGAFVTNPLTYRPRTPAHSPNAVLMPEGVLVHTGLPNPGVPDALRRWDKEWRRLGTPVIVHLAATTPGETARSLSLLERANGVAGIELGLRDDVSPADLAQLVREALGGQPLLVRLPVARAVELAPAAARAGADALTIAAPPRIEAATGDRRFSGRLYGVSIFAAALEALRGVAALNLGLPLVGAGGVRTAESAQSMLAAGAAAIQIDDLIWTQPQSVAALTAAITAAS